MAIQHGSSSGNCKSAASRPKATADIPAASKARAGDAAPRLEDAVIKLSSPRLRSAGLARQLALALVLASGTAMLAVPGFADAAHAQKRDKKKKDEAVDPAKPVYSKAFVDAYQPVNTVVTTDGADVSAILPQIEALVPLAVSQDEQLALGGLLFNAGIRTKDTKLQLRGAEVMLASGKVKPEEVGRFNLVAFQISASLNQYEKARTYLQKAIDLNYSAPNVSATDLQMNMAELFFSENRNIEGLQYLSDAIAARKAQGLEVDQRWYRRGVSVAYSNEIVPQVYDFVSAWVIDNPQPENWRDAVNLTRNLNDFEPAVMLDLLRLGRKVGTLTDKNDYIYYVESADARRLPQEVKDVIEEARAKGTIPKGTDSYVDEQLGIAAGRIAADRADLPKLERDADAATAQLRTVVGAGDAFLSYSDYAKAVRFYQKGLGMAGVDRDLVLTRLGIAQIGAGDAAGARDSLAQVQGLRAPIAKLWGAYAAQLIAAAAAPAPAAVATAS
jgi:tetratricopeptide (TPR) repeat protein